MNPCRAKRTPLPTKTASPPSAPFLKSGSERSGSRRGSTASTTVPNHARRRLSAAIGGRLLFFQGKLDHGEIIGWNIARIDRSSNFRRSARASASSRLRIGVCHLGQLKIESGEGPTHSASAIARNILPICSYTRPSQKWFAEIRCRVVPLCAPRPLLARTAGRNRGYAPLRHCWPWRADQLARFRPELPGVSEKTNAADIGVLEHYSVRAWLSRKTREALDEIAQA